jgi:hypothetical protein
MPGFHDAHIHTLLAGEATFELALAGLSIPAIQEAVRTYASAHPDPWIRGRGFALPALRSLPTHELLDAIDRPVALTDQSGHNLWVNAAAMRAANVTKATVAPPGGTIVRDAQGEPTGIFEDAAQLLIASKFPPPDEALRERQILAGERLALAAGITSAQGGPISIEAARTYARMDREHKLTQRAFLWAPLGATEESFREWTALAAELRSSDRVRIVAFKGFADGTFAASTAALLHPYADNPALTGNLYLTPDLAERLVLRANRAGFPVLIHAMGDRAVRAALDAFEKSKNVLHHNLVNRVEHAAMVDPVDAPRFKALGVAASVQPAWLRGFRSHATFFPEQHVGADRAATIYPWGMLAQAGATLLFGSDLPASPIVDPLVGLYGATHREFLDGTAFFPEQNIDPDAAIRAFTQSPAEAIGMGDRLGKIAPGYAADLVLLMRDPRTARSLADDPIQKVWMAGR